jgi:CTD kinase subunit gamma
VLNGLQQKSVLELKTVTELEAALKERDTAPGQTALSPSDGNAQREASGGVATTPKANGVGRLDRRQIEQRIEEDRERHKRLKETIWGVSGDGDVEFSKMLEECSDFGEDDRMATEEDINERRHAMRN